MMRVTQGSTNQAMLAGLQLDSSRLAALQEQISSGRQITKPSDDPSGTVTALQLRSQLSQQTQYQANATDAIGWLTTVDSTYSSINTQLQQVRTLVLQGMNTGSNSTTASNAIAQQITQSRTSLLSAANSTYMGRPVFGGTTAGSQAFDSTGAYVGDTGTVTRTVGPNSTVTLNSSATNTFGPTGSNLFDLLSTIAQDVQSNPSALAADLGQLDTRMAAISSDQALAGGKYQSIQNAQSASSTNVIQLKSQLSDVQDIDLADTVVQVTSANTAYQAALATTAKISQVSLLDFLR